MTIVQGGVLLNIQAVLLMKKTEKKAVNRAAAVRPRASVPPTSSGYPAVCTPSPHTVSAPRERSRSFRTSDTDRYFSYFACFYARKWFFH
ncbi:hypothetical protein EVAR_46393_1 [Eumeta japonica]|uniref:Histone H2A C-terminal domain-containing protein n=1 Tax=Eumeta variegata TaxID=151549 RepID=A0A4C1WU87_EUMVA|nr:hypothetical protein EVAR_46393_1 [Eumeta japonica]